MGTGLAGVGASGKGESMLFRFERFSLQVLNFSIFESEREEKEEEEGEAKRKRKPCGEKQKEKKDKKEKGKKTKKKVLRS
jgi:hypothetical protein